MLRFGVEGSLTPPCPPFSQAGLPGKGEGADGEGPLCLSQFFILEGKRQQ